MIQSNNEVRGFDLVDGRVESDGGREILLFGDRLLATTIWMMSEGGEVRYRAR